MAHDEYIRILYVLHAEIQYTLFRVEIKLGIFGNKKRKIETF